MSVETVSNVGDLNPAFPTGAEPKNQGDDHVRNIKAALRQSFAGYAGAVLVTGVDGGAANAYTLTPATALLAYSTKMLTVFVPTVTNTGAATLAISGMAAKPVVRVDGSPVTAGELTAGRFYAAFYDGAQFRLDKVTKTYIDQLVISGTLPGVSDPANAGKFLKGGGTWASIDGRGSPFIDMGDSGTAAQALTYSENAEGWLLRATGSFTLSSTGWPAGRLAGGLLRLTNGGAFSLTTTGITWIKPDGTTTASFSASGIVLQAVGINLLALVSYGDGVVYGKAC
jgi:hypothetical protein